MIGSEKVKFPPPKADEVSMNDDQYNAWHGPQFDIYFPKLKNSATAFQQLMAQKMGELHFHLLLNKARDISPWWRWSWTMNCWKPITEAQYNELQVCAALFDKIRLLRIGL